MGKKKTKKVKKTIKHNISELEKFMEAIQKLEPPKIKSICNLFDSCTDCPVISNSNWCHYDFDSDDAAAVVSLVVHEIKHVIADLQVALSRLE